MLFAVSGIVLLAINYFLVRAALPASVDTERTTIETPTGAAPGTALGPPPDAGADLLAQLRESMLNTLLAQSVLALGLTLLLVVALSWLVARRALGPVSAVASLARRLSVDSLDQRIRMRGPRDELTELADTFDEMLDRLAASFDAQRRFVANASHELRTPLAAQRTMVEVAMSRPAAGATVQELGGRLLAMNARVEALIQGMLILARSDRGLAHKRAVRLDDVVRRVLAAQHATAQRAGVQVHYAAAPRTVNGDPLLLEQLVSNLVENGLKYNEPGGALWVAVGPEPALRVRNTGPAVPAESTPELFEPFRQLRLAPDRDHRGVGLGLSIVASVARAHGGSAHAHPRDGGGLDVAVTLP